MCVRERQTENQSTLSLSPSLSAKKVLSPCHIPVNPLHSNNKIHNARSQSGVSLGNSQLSNSHSAPAKSVRLSIKPTFYYTGIAPQANQLQTINEVYYADWETQYSSHGSSLIKPGCAGRKLSTDFRVKKFGALWGKRWRATWHSGTKHHKGWEALVRQCFPFATDRPVWWGRFPVVLTANKSTSSRFPGKDSVCIFQLICFTPTAGHEIDRKWYKHAKQKQRYEKLHMWLVPLNHSGSVFTLLLALAKAWQSFAEAHESIAAKVTCFSLESSFGPHCVFSDFAFFHHLQITCTVARAQSRGVKLI